MNAPFLKLPATAGYVLENANILGPDGLLHKGALAVHDGKFVEHVDGPAIDVKSAIIAPLFTDMHTHLDKGHILPRKPNPDGTFMGALEAVGADRVANWSAEDVRARMDFALRCAYVHGTGAIRTHIDSLAPQDAISWPVFCDIRDEWRGKIELQAACLLPIDSVEADGPFTQTADIVTQSGGILGAVTYPMDDLKSRLKLFFQTAQDQNLSVDFHVDETGDPSVATLRTIAETVLETGFDAPVVVGHCCSLAVQEQSEADHTLDLVAQAGLHVVSLPMCNLYLQARQAGQTPRWRGVTLVHEMKKRGINVSFASDNTRDPFYAYGDLDMVEVMREATRIAHLDHNDPDWMKAFNVNPNAACGFDRGHFDAGSAADFIIFNARSMNELLSRPQSDRFVVRGGTAITDKLPNYCELDHLKGIK